MNQDHLEWAAAIVIVLIAAFAVTYGWLRLIDFTLWVTRGLKPKQAPTTAPGIKL